MKRSYIQRSTKPMKRSGFSGPRKRLRAIGKKGRQWADMRRDELKPAFEATGITSCELRYEHCANDNYLGFAHAAKRRKLSVDDLNHVILCCNFCHQRIEVLPPEQMKSIVDKTIAARCQDMVESGCEDPN